ncbi:unnamed protein product [Bursaphelenchus xylophilus]|uniref:(pine wood nematode) hypothetical protein n=1 Tax=Bursaphelenchus xylophilus TaxID=6326 RepID=A0A7I8XAL8_BURXY|nr:unnamed protein product [Bursaphelenchus xylophilus]CAG9082941.1 unnamed protein product [Bursaphelenchus xylophilus]
MGKVFGIAGCTNAGKTTLSKNLTDKIANVYGYDVIHLLQDDFFHEKEKVARIPHSTNKAIVFYDYDSCQALDISRMKNAVIEARDHHDLVILEGNLLTLMPEMIEIIDEMVFLSLDKATCEDRRVQRTDYDPPDLPGYFEQVVWPAYEDTLRAAQRIGGNVEIVEGNREDLINYALIKVFECFNNFVRLTHEEISVEEVSNIISSDQSGGQSLFIGTTRNNFEDKKVVSLSYEAYEPMAYQELWLICKETRARFPDLHRICIYHLLGDCPVGNL